MKRILMILMGLILCLQAMPQAQGDDAAPEMSLLAINVRKADALLLRCGESAYLIDTGAKKESETLLSVLRSEGISRLTGVIITHTDSDHVGGLKALAESEIEIENIYTSRYYVLKKEDGKHPVEKALKKTDYTFGYLAGGDELPLDGGKLTVLGPVEMNEEAENCNSLVLLAEGGGGSILLTGDMEFPEEDSLLKAGLIPQVDVIKIGNHGEGDATSTQLIVTAAPSLAVISTNSDDEPDTPDPRVLQLLRQQNVRVLLTQDSVQGVLVTLKGGEILTEIK